MNPRQDSVSLLKEVFDRKAKANPRFSLRAFARHLGISAAGLSQILSRKKRLSIDRAHEFARKLNLDTAESRLFLGLVEAESCRSQARRAELYEKLGESSNGAAVPFNLSVDQFRLLSSWSGFAVLELVTEVDPSLQPRAIAARLGVTLAEVEATLDRLERLELIERTPADASGRRYRRIQETLLVTSNHPEEAIRNYYGELLDKAAESLDTQTPQERISGAQVFALDPAQLGEARKLTHDYLDALNALAMKGEQRTEIYQATTHVFRLTQANPRRKRK
jgi:uncharacterized protein (TIGR02147 family)